MRKVMIFLLSAAVLSSSFSCKSRESNDNNGTNNPTPKSQTGKVTFLMDGKTTVYDNPIINYVGSGTTFSVTHLSSSGTGDFDLSSLTTKSLEAGSKWDGVISATIDAVNYTAPDVQFTIDSYDGKEKISGSFSGSFYDSPGVRRSFTGSFETNHLVQSK